MPSASSSPPSHPDIPPFPSPSTFSILPDIYLLIARLKVLQHPPSAPTEPIPTSSQTLSQSQSQSQTQSQSQSSHPQSQTQLDSQAQTQTQTQTQLQPPQPTTNSTLTATSTQQPQPASLSTSGTPSHIHLLQTGPPLDLKDLPAQIYPIKQKLAKAKAAVTALPDVERTVADQEREIQELERTVALLKRRLATLATIATDESVNRSNGAGNGEEEMEDVREARGSTLKEEEIKGEEGKEDVAMQGLEG